jgi:ubiquinone/menaquinone biosynthesis C-methylase UbiE
VRRERHGGRGPRVDYDAVAHLYDTQPYRARAVDPELLALAGQDQAGRPAVLDIGCGTGNQLIANRGALPEAFYAGLDRSFGMLRQARGKACDIAWVEADGAALPFRAGSFDYVCCHFAFHHIVDKAGMLRSVRRVLRPGGRFVLRNLCPQESSDWLYYQYFPEARLVDDRDFWPVDDVLATMQATGFVEVRASYEHIRFEQDLAAWLEIVRRRDTCSQLQAIPEAAYQAGVERLARDAIDPNLPPSRDDHLCLVTIRGAAPAAGIDAAREVTSG